MDSPEGRSQTHENIAVSEQMRVGHKWQRARTIQKQQLDKWADYLLYSLQKMSPPLIFFHHSSLLSPQPGPVSVPSPLQAKPTAVARIPGDKTVMNGGEGGKGKGLLQLEHLFAGWMSVILMKGHCVSFKRDLRYPQGKAWSQENNQKCWVR